MVLEVMGMELNSLNQVFVSIQGHSIQSLKQRRKGSTGKNREERGGRKQPYIMEDEPEQRIKSRQIDRGDDATTNGRNETHQR